MPTADDPYEQVAPEPRDCGTPKPVTEARGRDPREETMSKRDAKNSKRSFDHARNTMWTIPPEDLCIIGGRKLPAEERGKLDTDDGDEHELYDPRIFDPLTEEFILNIDAFGVDTPVVISKIDDVPVVIFGKTRVRAARAANRRRKARGEPLISIDCKIKRGNTTSLLAAMIVENENRRDDGIPAKLDKLKRLMARGVSAKDASVIFGVKEQTVKGWLAFDDNATAETKKAAEAGRLSHTAAAALARIKDPDAQRAQLDRLLSTEGRVSKGAAREAAQGANGKKVAISIADKRTQRRLLSYVQNIPHGNAGEKTMAWWEGVEEALKLVVGEADVNPRLVNKVDELISLMKIELRAKRPRPSTKPGSAPNAEHDRRNA